MSNIFLYIQPPLDLWWCVSESMMVYVSEHDVIVIYSTDDDDDVYESMIVHTGDECGRLDSDF